MSKFCDGIIRSAGFGKAGCRECDKLIDALQDMAKDVAFQRSRATNVTVTAKDVREALRRLARQV